MDNGKRVFSPALFGLILICFLLPFVNISCSGQELGSFNGLQLITGTKIQGEAIDPHPIAIIIFLIAIIGLIFALVKTKLGNVICSIVAGAGFVFTLLLKSNIDGEIAQERYLTAEWGVGYYFTLILFVVAVGFNIYLMTTKKNLPKSPGISVPKGGKFCPQCGTRNDADSGFCSECGYRMSTDSRELQEAETVEPSYTPPIYEPDNGYQPNITEATSSSYEDNATQLLQQPVYPVLKVDRNGVEEIIPINKPEFTLGRNQDIVDYYEADNNNIGRTHAKIITQNNTYLIVDLDSKNGTYVNGNRLTNGEPYPLVFKDKITLANVDYTFDED